MSAATRVAERHPVRWLTAAPLWSPLLAERGDHAAAVERMHRPALLRVASDDFMADLAALLDSDPLELRTLEAVPTSYRAAPPGAPKGYESPADQLKLFQPVHGHFNLVAATLACAMTGLPDKAVDPTTDDEVAFVLRRLDGDRELAWTGDGWDALDPNEVIRPGEQLLPMFPVPYAEGARTRRLLMGLIPTSSTEITSGGPVPLLQTGGASTAADQREEELDTRIIQPLRAVLKAAEATTRLDVSRFILLDLGDFLARHAAPLWKALRSETRPDRGGRVEAYDMLRETIADAMSGHSWLQALMGVWDERLRIWGDVDEAPTYKVDLSRGQIDPDQLRSTLIGALPRQPSEQVDEPPPNAPKFDPRPGVHYHIRCVFRRPSCGPLRPDVISDPSQPFAVASFFDVDAPARPITISLPVDTSIAGLRKAPRNISVLISRQLREQMQRVRTLKDALDGNVGAAASFDVGQICSFSIPIVTICALILLFMLVSLLNIVFWWVPFFRICLPLRDGE